MQIELNAQEIAALEEVLSTSLGGLREEVYKAEVAEYKARLQQREAVLAGLLERLRSVRPASA